MKTKNFTKCCLWGLLSLLAPIWLYAEGDGTISGRITDQKTGEPLIGVTILLDGTSKGAITDVQGAYLISGVPAGKQTLLFKYIGYQSKTVTGVQVNTSRNTLLNITLEKSASQKLNEVLVTSTYKKASINALYAKRKNSSFISDGISADLIRKSPDKNTGDVLKRISGISIQNDKFVVVRGLAARYNATMMNDAVMPATEPDKKAFSFNIIPANLISNIVIYKTASPDHPGDAAGGTIQVNTKDFPSQKFISLSIGTGYNTQTTFEDFEANRTSGKYDFLSFTDGSGSLPEAFKKVQKNYAALSTAEKLKITKQFPNTYGGIKDNPSLPPLSLQFSAGNTKIFDNGNKLGLTGAINYSSSRQKILANRNEYLLSKEHLYDYNDERFSKNYHTGAILNVGYTFGKNKISLKNFFSNELENIFTRRTGQVFASANYTPDIFSLNSQTTQNGLFNSVLEGKHSLDHQLNINWNVSYGRSYRLQPDQHILSVYQTPFDPYYSLRLSNENSPAIEDAGRVYSRLHENIYSGYLNLSKPFRLFNKAQKLKVGMAKVYRDRAFKVQALGYASELDPYGRGATIPFNKGISPANIFSIKNLKKYKIILANIPQNTKDYTGRADLNAGYVMFDNRLADNWRLTWGARIENYHQKLISVNQPVQDYKNTDILPSANLTWSVTNKTNVHMAYSRTLNRPQFRELAAFRYYDYQNDFIVSGNPNLQRSINDNVDLRVEYYPASGEILSASVFYKSFQHPIEQTNLGNNVLSYSNADKALDYGVEVEVRKKLDFIGLAFLKNLMFYANASFIRGSVTFDGENIKQPMQGQSPYMINSGLSYASAKNYFSVSVLYNRIGQRLRFRGENGGLDTYEKPRNLLDFQVSKKLFNRKAEVRLNVSDILAQPTILYYKYGNGSKTDYNAGNDKIISSIQDGTNVSVSFKYFFFH